jgi:AcrR family transcriptional regulator
MRCLTPSLTVMSRSMSSSEELILKSARTELAKSGILGLRVAEVARGAHCSITNIYRYFGDRDGLLARVLGDMYEEFTEQAVASYLALFEGRNDVTVDELARAIPLPRSEQSIKMQEFRLQIMAAATENPQLLARLEDITRKRASAWINGVEILRSRMAAGEDFDERVFLIQLANHMPFYNYLLGDMGATEEQFQQFVADKLRANPQPRQN